jgi:serine/threonine protein kinase
MAQSRSAGTHATVTLPASTFSPCPEDLLRQALDPAHHPQLLGALDHYEVFAVLGAGATGLVLRARDTRNGDRVAIKMLYPDVACDPTACRRFLREARHLQSLSHPHILPVSEVADRPQSPYFVMPLIEQGTLARRIQPGHPLDPGFALIVARQVAAAVAHAHRSGIVHHDLKPGNVLLDDRPHAFLSDFGLARALFGECPVPLEAKWRAGTAAYMSPAVAMGEVEDNRCDIYSFGALVYEMLTGYAPYRGKTSEEIVRQILAGPPCPIRELNPSASPGLAGISEVAMARAARDRYASMADVVADLDRVSQGEPPRGR